MLVLSNLNILKLTRGIALSIVLSLSINLISSQNQFRINYDIGSFDIPGGITEASSGNYVFAGFNSNALPPFYSNVVELDVSGNVVWAKNYSSGLVLEISDIKTLSTGDYIISGAASEATLMNLDVSGNLNWGYEYDFLTASSTYTSRVTATSDGGYVVAGSVKGYDPGGTVSSGDSSNIYIFKTNSSGTALWKKVLFVDVDNDHSVNDVAEVVDGYIFVGRVSESSVLNQEQGDAIILKTDFNGVIQWFYKYGDAGVHEEFNSAVTLSNGEVLIGGSDDNSICLLRVNSSGSLTWGYDYDPGGSMLGLDVAVNFNAFETNDNKYASLGMYLEFNFPSFAIGTYLTKIEPSNGNVIFEKFYSSGMSSIIPEGIQVSDDGYLMSMMAQQMTGFNFHVLKTDSNGDTPPSCLPSSISFSKSSYSPSGSIVNYSDHSDVGEAVFTPSISSVTPTEVVDCISCTLPAAGTNGAFTLCTTDPSTDLFSELGGTPDVGGTWSPAMSSGTGIFDPAVDLAGTYTYSVTNSCGTATADVVVTITSCTCPIVITETLTDEQCNGACDGEIIINITGGTGPYQVEWFDGTGTSLGVVTGVVSTATLSNLCPGNYSVEVTEASGSGGPTSVWSEDFQSGLNGWTLNVSTGTNGTDYNYFEMDDDEGGMPIGQCGVANNGDITLHVTSVFNPSGGAAYDAGGLCGIWYCPESNRRSESPNINTTGFIGLTLGFNFIANGDGLTDNASLLYNDGSGWTVLDPSLKSPVCGGGQGEWTAYSVALPASCDNIPNLQIGFNWTNNDDGIGTDPSFAVNVIKIFSTGGERGYLRHNI